MLCKCHWIVLYTVHFTAFCLGGPFFLGHGVFYGVYCVLMPYGVINDDSEVYAVCFRPSVRPAPA